MSTARPCNSIHAHDNVSSGSTVVFFSPYMIRTGKIIIKTALRVNFGFYFSMQKLKSQGRELPRDRGRRHYSRQRQFVTSNHQSCPVEFNTLLHQNRSPGLIKPTETDPEEFSLSCLVRRDLSIRMRSKGENPPTGKESEVWADRRFLQSYSSLC